jgi:hypothetical protein
MQDELAARQRAVTLRLAGRPIKAICTALGRSEVWFHKWWRRYLQSGPEGLYDLTRANYHVAQHISPELERSILTVRRRLQAHATPATRYSLIGAPAILAELKVLGVRPLPCERTVERVLERNGLTAPRVRLAPLLPRQPWPGPQGQGLGVPGCQLAHGTFSRKDGSCTIQSLRGTREIPSPHRVFPLPANQLQTTFDGG